MIIHPALRDAFDHHSRYTTDPDEALLCARSDAYHDHPSHPTTCRAYAEHHDGRRCPCEVYEPEPEPKLCQACKGEGSIQIDTRLRVRCPDCWRTPGRTTPEEEARREAEVVALADAVLGGGLP